MFSEKNYMIAFDGLKPGSHQFEFLLGNEFFEAFEYGLIKKASVNIALTLEKSSSSMMVLNFIIKGKVIAECDLCLDPVEKEISGSNRLIVKFAEESEEGNDELMVLSRNDHEINLTQHLYEITHTTLPIKIVHKEGECNPDMIDKLNQQKPPSDDDIDPRWEALKELN